MKSEKSSLLSLFKSRLELAKKWTEKNFIEDSKKSIQDYNFSKTYDQFEAVDTDKIALAANRRYNQTLPVIFSYTEALKASVFDRYFDVIIKQRGKKDDEKAVIIEATYKYLKDKLNLDNFQIRAFDWFALLGWVSAHTSFKTEYYEVPYTDEATGEPQFDEAGNPIMLPVYTYNDPIVKLNKFDKVFFSPESEFEDSDNVSIPYYIIEDAITEDEAEDIYGKEVEADIKIETESSKDIIEEDCEKVAVYHYYGSIPSDYKKQVKGWDVNRKFYAVFTKKKILLKPEYKKNTNCAFGKFLGLPDSFFGYGFGKIGRYFQQEKSVRRGQQTRLADLAAYPKWLLKDDGQNMVDTRALADPRALPFLKYKTQAPELSATPNLAEVVTASENANNQDAQQVFGILDLVAASQDGSTVTTATGQSMFADAANKRIKLARKKFGEFYLEVVKNLFKLCAENWEDDKIVTITDDDGNPMEVTLSKEGLKDIDFDNDLMIDIENQNSNKDLQKAQNIELYDRMKDDPLINRKEIVKKLLQENYDVEDTEKFFTTPQLPEGTQLSDAQGNQYTIDKTGQLVPAQAEQTTSQPTSEGGVPSSESAIMGGSQDVGA